MKHECLKCHFLTKQFRDEGGSVYAFSWTQADRKTRAVDKHYSPNCHLGVWDAGIDPSITSRLGAILTQNRRHFCFFIEVHEGMSFQSAKELQHRREENAQLKRTNRYAVVGLWIAALALLASLLLDFFGGSP
jgi:hypothetical protein